MYYEGNYKKKKLKLNHVTHLDMIRFYILARGLILLGMRNLLVCGHGEDTEIVDAF